MKKNGAAKKRHGYNRYRGLSVISVVLCALFLGAISITSIRDYKNQVNNFLGVKETFSGGEETYAFKSEYNNTKEMLTERKKISEEIEEEGCVLLKNNNNVLPLSDMKKVTILGSSAYPYDENGNMKKPADNPDAWGIYSLGGLVGGSPITTEEWITTDGTYRSGVSLEQALEEKGIVNNPQMEKTYLRKNTINTAPGNPYTGTSDYDNAFGATFSTNEPELSLSECGDFQNYNDACFVVLCRTSSEGCDYYPGSVGVNGSKNQTSSLGLSDDERNLITIANQISSKVVVLLVSAIPMEIEELKNDDRVGSILWIGLAGSFGMNSVAKVLTGEVSPSGHCADTFAVSASASPAAQNFGVTDQNDASKKFTWSADTTAGYTYSDNSHYVVMAENIYTGYYYYETRYADVVEGNGNASLPTFDKRDVSNNADRWVYENEVSYTFGYGLSYTTFEQEIVKDSVKYDAKEKTVTLDVTVKNTGNYPAKSVVQLYAQAPYTQYDKTHNAEKSAVQLMAFGKTKTLYPNAQADAEKKNEETITLTFDLKYLATYDKTIAHDNVTGGYILEKGDYYFAIGNGAHEAVNNILYAKDNDALSRLYLEDGVVPSTEQVVTWTPETDAGISFNADGVNTSLFATSENGTIIKNQMEDIDYNYFNTGDTVTYLSRSDWQKTFPVSYPFLKLNDRMKRYLVDNNGNGGVVYKFQTGSVKTNFGVDHEERDDEQNLSVSDFKLCAYEDERWAKLVEQITFDEAWRFSPYGGGSCIKLNSVSSPEVWQIDGPNGNTTRSLGAKANDSGPMAVKSNDPNYNLISRCMPCEPIVASTFNIELIAREGAIFGEDMLWSNNPIIWAPGMNLHRTPFNSRNHEYYSEDAMLTNILGTAFVRAGVQKGAIISPKHFALNSQESFREGLIQFTNEQTMRERELRAFQGVYEDVNYVNALGTTVNCLGTMTSFSRVGVCGINAHTGITKNVLRREWGFKGLSSTDMVIGGRFFNPIDCLANNVTFMATSNAENLLTQFWTDYNAKLNIKKDPYLCSQLAENMHYYLYAVANSCALNGCNANIVMEDSLYAWEWALRILAGGFAGLTFVFVTLAVVHKSKED